MTQEYVRLRKFQGLELMQRRPYTLRKKEQAGRMQERCIIKDISSGNAGKTVTY